MKVCWCHFQSADQRNPYSGSVCCKPGFLLLDVLISWALADLFPPASYFCWQGGVWDLVCVSTAGRCWWASCWSSQSSSFQFIPGNWKTAASNICSLHKPCCVFLCQAHCSLWCIDRQINKQKFPLNSLHIFTPGVYTSYMHINFLLMTVSQISLYTGHTSHISICTLHLYQCWCSQCNSTWIYANVWISLCILLAFVSNCQLK